MRLQLLSSESGIQLVKHSLTAILLVLSVPSWAQESGALSGVSSSIDLEIYGYVKLDAAYDTARTSTGDFVKWVELAPGNDDDDAFNMTANQSRLGVKIGVRDESDEPRRVETSGRFEMDFYGGGAANKAHLMLRHAYLRVLWPESGIELIAGQTGDLISPLNPQTLNYSVAWWGGNIGYRRPQLRLSRPIELSSHRTLRIAGALARSIGSTDSAFTGNDAGADSGLPSVQSRIGLSLAGGSSYGLSGHWGQEEYDRSAAGDESIFESWSLNLDAKQRLAPKVLLQAEVFTGVNLQTYLGGIGQGVNLDRLQEIGASGGWVSLDIGPHESWTYHLGVSVDDVHDEDVDAGARSRNLSIFVNGVYSLTDSLQIGCEFSHWATEYKNRDEANVLRGQFSLVYRF